MSLSDISESIHNLIYTKKNDLGEKIHRLKDSFHKISILQNRLIQEMNNLNEPNLANKWTGKRAVEFEANRNAAYSLIKDIAYNKYDQYLQAIV